MISILVPCAIFYSFWHEVAVACCIPVSGGLTHMSWWFYSFTVIAGSVDGYLYLLVERRT